MIDHLKDVGTVKVLVDTLIPGIEKEDQILVGGDRNVEQQIQSLCSGSDKENVYKLCLERKQRAELESVTEEELIDKEWLLTGKLTVSVFVYF